MAAASGGFLASTQAKLLLAGVVVVGGGGTAFVMTDGFGLMEGGQNLDVPHDAIPEDVDAVIHVDRGIIDSQATEELMNGYIDIAREQSMGYDGPDSYQAMLDEAAAESPIEIEGFQSATVFGRADEFSASAASDYAGVIVESDWDESEITALIEEESDGDVAQESYNGVTLYHDDVESEFEDDSWFAALGDGRFVFGTEESTKDAIDVHQGDAPTWSGDLREAFTAAEAGHVKVATIVPEGEADAAGGQMIEGLDDVSIVTMTYRSEGSSMAVDLQMTTSTADSASTLHSSIEDTLGFLGMMAAEEPQVETLLENLETSQSGTQVTISYSTTVQELLSMLEEFGDPTGMAQQGGSFSVASPDATAAAAG